MLDVQHHEEKRERFLSAAELRCIGEVLREMEAGGLEMPSVIAAVMLLILTGCRLNEIMTLRWEYVDLGTSTLNLPDSKTGAKVVQIGKPAADVLRRIPRLPGNPWVITGKLPDSRPSDLQPFWQRLRARACLKDARIHDLRHTFASTDDRQAARPHTGRDDGAVRALGSGSGEGGGEAGVVDDRQVNLLRQRG